MDEHKRGEEKRRGEERKENTRGRENDILTSSFITVDGVQQEYLRNSFMTTLAPPPTSVYLFTPEQISQIKFDEPDSQDTITWNDASEGPSSFSIRRSASLKRSASGSETPMLAMRSVTIVKLIERMTNGYTGMLATTRKETKRGETKEERGKKRGRGYF